jgi:hypothetical protein
MGYCETLKETVTAVRAFESSQQHAQERDADKCRCISLRDLWHEQCDMQTPLRELVLAKLEYKYSLSRVYIEKLLHEFDAWHKHAGPSTSLLVYAYVLFKRFKKTFKRYESMDAWFMRIPVQEIGTNIESISNNAISFASKLGVQNVVFAMCVIVAHQMLESDVKKFTASLWVDCCNTKATPHNEQQNWKICGHKRK